MISQEAWGLGSTLVLFLGFAVLLAVLNASGQDVDRELDQVRSQLSTYLLEVARNHPAESQAVLGEILASPVWLSMVALRTVNESELRGLGTAGAGAEALLAKVATFQQKQRHTFTILFVLLLLASTVIVAAAVAFYALSEQRRKLGQRLRRLHQQSLVAIEAERQAISRDLHDTVAQDLAAVKMLLSQVEVRPEIDHPLRSSLDSALAQVRQVAHGLRPAALDRVGLSACLKDLCEAVKSSGLHLGVDLPSHDAVAVEDRIAVQVYRIAQEALQNTVRHSRCRSAHLGLSIEPGLLRFFLSDDGVGLEASMAPGRAEERRLGLIGMQERATLVGGTLRIESSRDAGTRLSLEVPL